MNPALYSASKSLDHFPVKVLPPAGNSHGMPHTQQVVDWHALNSRIDAAFWYYLKHTLHVACSLEG